MTLMDEAPVTLVHSGGTVVFDRNNMAIDWKRWTASEGEAYDRWASVFTVSKHVKTDFKATIAFTRKTES